MNQTIETILQHRSIRAFTDQQLTKEEVQVLVASAQAASTSNYVQAYSIIGITDPEKKAALAELAGNQSYVRDNGHLFVFCVDFHRNKVLAESESVNIEKTIENTEAFMVGVIDATLAAQNLTIAAESLGLGICYIGGLRNNLKEVSKLLGTPDYVLPLYGLVVGHPASPSDMKPRLPMGVVYHENEYQTDEETFKEVIAQHDEQIAAYYKERTGGVRTDTFSKQIAKQMATPKREYLHDFVQDKGFNKR